MVLANEKLTERPNGTLKLIAIMTMLIDHIGLVFFPELDFPRIIGRIALPIFAFQIAQGTMYTSSKLNYIARLLTFAVISQLPYMLLLQTYTLNILFTLVLSAIIICCIQYKQWIWILVIIILFTIVEYSSLPKFEYTWYGVLMPVIFYIFRNSKKNTLIFQSIITCLFVFTYPSDKLQIYAVLGFLICLYFPLNKFKTHINKFFFYYFYPSHLMIFYFLAK